MMQRHCVEGKSLFSCCVCFIIQQNELQNERERLEQEKAQAVASLQEAKDKVSRHPP